MVTMPTKGRWYVSEAKNGRFYIYSQRLDDEENNYPIQPNIKIAKKHTKTERSNLDLIVMAVNEYKLRHGME